MLSLITLKLIDVYKLNFIHHNLKIVCNKYFRIIKIKMCIEILFLKTKNSFKKMRLDINNIYNCN